MNAKKQRKSSWRGVPQQPQSWKMGPLWKKGMLMIRTKKLSWVMLAGAFCFLIGIIP